MNLTFQASTNAITGTATTRSALGTCSAEIEAHKHNGVWRYTSHVTGYDGTQTAITATLTQCGDVAAYMFATLTAGLETAKCRK